GRRRRPRRLARVRAGSLRAVRARRSGRHGPRARDRTLVCPGPRRRPRLRGRRAARRAVQARATYGVLMGDEWEDGFDSWTPREQGTGADDTGTDLDREALLKLARELLERRQAERTDSDGELERLKQTLRE